MTNRLSTARRKNPEVRQERAHVAASHSWDPPAWTHPSAMHEAKPRPVEKDHEQVDLSLTSKYGSDS